MLKPERVTFSADDDKFHQFANRDQLNSFLNNSLVHYSTDFKKTEHQQEVTSIKHSNSLGELSSITMSSQEQQQNTEHEPPASAPPSLVLEENPLLNENNLHQFDALTLQQLAIDSSINEEDIKTSPSHSTSLSDIQKEVDRVRQMKYGRTYSSPTSSLCSRLTTNPFHGSNNTIDLSSITHSVHFNEQSNQTNHLPFSSTYITSIPESIVPPSGSSSTNDNHFIPINSIESPTLEDREVFETFHTKQTSMPGIAIRQSVNTLNRNITSSETDFIASLHRSASKQALDNQSEHGTTYSGTSDDLIFVEWDKERSLFQDYINSLRTEIRVLLQERSEYQKQMETINNNLSEHKRLNITQINTDQTKFDLLQKSLEEKNLVLEHLQKEYEIHKEKNTNLSRKISILRCDAKAQTGVIDELKQKIVELTVDIQNHILVKRRLEISMMNLESDCNIIDAERIRLNNDIKDTQLSKQELEKLLQQANVQIAEQGSTIEMLRSDNIQVRSQLSATQRRMLQEKQQVMDYLRQIENDLVEKEQVKQRESILRRDFEKLQVLHQQDRQEIEQLNSQINQDKQKLDQLEQERLQLLKTIQNMDDNKMQSESELDSYKSATKRLYTHFKIPFDSIQSIDQIIPMLEDRYRTEQISHARVHHIPLVQSTSGVNDEQETEEIHQLREDLVSMNIKLKQLDEANQAWQQYQQNQLILLHDRLNLNDIDNLSFEDIVQQIENRFNDLNKQLNELQDIQQTNDDIDGLKQTIDELRAGNTQITTDDICQSKDTQTEKSIEIPVQSIAPDVSKYEEEFQRLQENLVTLTVQCAQLDEANRAWQQFHQTQLDNFRDKLQNSFPLENSVSLDDMAQNMILHLDQLQNEREGLMQQLQTSEKFNNDLRSESIDDHQIIKQTYVNTINELSHQLNILKQNNDQLETEKYILNQQHENQSTINIKQERNTPTPDSLTSDLNLVKKHTHTAPTHEAQIHTITPLQSASPLINEHPNEQEQELQQLRDNIALLTSQCAQLDEANRAWQLYQQTQFHNFTNTIHHYLPIEETSSLDQAAQQIIDLITKERQDFTQRYHALEQVNDHLRSESETNLETIKQSYINTVNELNQELLVMKEKNEQINVLGSSDQQETEEIVELRRNIVSLTVQLDQTNRAWQQYQQTQLDTLRNQLQSCLSIDYNTSVDDIAQQIVDQVTREREEFRERYEAIEKTNDELRSESVNSFESIRESYVNTMNELNEELLAMKEAYEQLDAEKQLLTNELEKRSMETGRDQVRPSIERVQSPTFRQPFAEVPIHMSGVNNEREAEEVRKLRENVVALTTQCAQLDEANRAWQQYQQTQSDNFRHKLQDYLSIDENASLDEIAQQIVDQMTKEKEILSERYQVIEKSNDELRSESADNLESIKESYINTVNELNQELLAMKEAYEELDAEKQLLSNELEKRPVENGQIQGKQTIERVPSNTSKQPFAQVPIHSSGANVEEEAEELEQLRENVMTLSAQCAQLDEANRAWQLYHQTQFENFRNAVHDYLLIDESSSLDQAAQQIVDQITKEREEFSERYAELERSSDDLHSESATNLETLKQSYVNNIDELNKELVSIKEECEQLKAVKQVLNNQLEKQSVDFLQEEHKHRLELAAISLSHEVPSHPTTSNLEQETDEVQELRENLATLSSQHAQLNEANHAWLEFHQTQLDNFRSKVQDCIQTNDGFSFDQIAQQIVDQITKERGDFADQYQQVLHEKEILLNQIENQPVINNQEQDTQTLESTNTNLLHQQTEMFELRENLASLTSQLDTTNRTWQQFEQTQLDLLKTLLPFSNKTSLEEIIQEIISHINQLTQEIDSYKEKERDLTENFEYINNQYEQLLEEKRVSDTQANQKDDDKIEQDLVVLQNQCAQLDTANRAWQSFYGEQIDLVKNKLQNYINFDDNLTFDQIIQLIVIQFEQQNRLNENIQSDTTNDNLDLLKTQLIDSQSNEKLLHQQIFTLQLEYQTLEQQLKDHQYSIDSLKNNLQFLSNENEQYKQQYEEVQQKNDLLLNTNHDLTNRLNDFERQSSPFESRDSSKQIFQKQTSRHTPIQEAQIHTITPVQSAPSSDIEEEIQQLRTNLSSLTTQCSQLDEANRAWQQFHQNQLEIFRNKLQDWISLEDNSTLEQIAQRIVIHLDELGNNNQLDTSSAIDSMQKQLVNYQLNESHLAQNLEQLNQKLIDVYKECEEFREQNAELISSKQRMENQLDEREQRINDLQFSNYNSEQLFQLQQHNDSLILENQQLQLKLNDMEQRLSQVSIVQRVDSPRENIAIHNIDRDRDEEVRQLRTDLAAASAHCLRLDEANRAWQQYQYEQIESFRQKLQDRMPSLNQMENSSLDFIAQQVIHYLDDITVQREGLMRHIDSLKDEIQLQKQQLERPGSADSEKRMLRRRSYDKNIREAQIHTVTPLQSASPLINEHPHEQELQQLRDNIALLTSQCAQLDEANRAWQLYQQTQFHNFTNTIHHYLPIEETSSLDQAAQQIIDLITKERQDFTQRYHALEQVNDHLRSESETNLETIKQSYINTVNELNQELLVMKEKNEQINELGSSDQQETEEIVELRRNVVSLTVQLDETNRAWQQYQQTQLDTLRNQLHSCLSIDYNTSFEDIAQQIVDQVTREREEFRERYEAIEKTNDELRSESVNSFESIRESYVNTMNELNEELLAMKEAYEQLDAEKQVLSSELEKRSMETGRDQVRPSIERVQSPTFRQPFAEVPIHTIGMNSEREAEEVRQLRENVVALSTQCAQLDEANRAWQQYQQTQSDNFRHKLQDYLPIDENASLDEMIQQMIHHISKEREGFGGSDRELQKVNDELRSESANNLESIRESHINTVNELNQELLAMKEAYEELDAEKQLLSNELEKRPVENGQIQGKQTIERVSSNTSKQPFAQVPIHSSGANVEEEAEELEQLRENVMSLSAQCTQLDEANRAWQKYQQTQFDNFRNKICDVLPIHENTSFDEIAQQIADQIIKEREAFRERYSELNKTSDELRSEPDRGIQSVEPRSTDNGVELNQELLVLRNQYEELEKFNKQLLFEKEELNNQLNDRSIVVGHHSASESNIVENEAERQSPLIPTETDEIRQIRADFASITSQLTELTQANQNERDSFSNKLQNWISLSPNSTFDEIAHQLNNHFEQKQQNIAQTTESGTQATQQSEKVDIAIETIPLTYTNHQTQIDPIDMIDQQIQTESFQQLWSTADDENLFNSDEDDDRLKEYIDEISSLSSTDLSNRLNKDCHQILFKQNFQISSYPNLDLNHHALLTIYLLYNQHLTDDAKQLYNETLLRALKQEYELISNEKNDAIENLNSIEEKYLHEMNFNANKYEQLRNKYDELLEQNELERLDSKQSLNDLIEKYESRDKQMEFNLYNLHQENEKLRFNFKNLDENYRNIVGKDYEQVERDYQQLRKDFNDLMNENELLKDYNSQMYQRKLQDNDSEEIQTSHDVDIQCNLSDELRSLGTVASSWTNDWDEENTSQHLPMEEQGSEQLSNEEEINRLKAIISEIELENDNLKDLNSQFYQASLQNANTDPITHQSISQSHDTDIQQVLQPISADKSVQTEIENEQYEKIQTSSNQANIPETEGDGWNDQMSPIEIPSEESSFPLTPVEPMIKQTIDNGTQTDEQSQDRHAQVNNKLKRALQTIKDKIHQAVVEQPEIFSDTSDDTIERLDHLISTIGNQATQIDILQNEREHMLNKSQQSETEPIVPTSTFSEREVDITEYENRIRSLAYERDNLLERNKQLEKDIHEIQSNVDIHPIDQRISAPSDIIQEEQQHTETVTLNEDEEPSLTNRLFGFISNVTSSSRTNETIDNETQTDEQPHDKLTQVNNKLKRALQTIKDKIHQAVIDRPELFSDTSDDTIERLDHLISTIGNQATQIDNLQNEYDHAQHEINQLQSSLEAYKYQIDNERATTTEQFVSTASPFDDMSQSTIEDQQNQINQLQQKLSANEDEQTLLRERLNEVELEFRKTLDDHAAIITINEEQLDSLVHERDALVEQQVHQSAESQHEIDQLHQEIDQLKQSSVTSHVDHSSSDDIKSLQEVIQQQSEELRDLSDRYFALSSQIETQDEVDRQKKETEERLTNYENQVQHLLRERSNLLDEIQKNAALSVQITDNEKQTGDQQHDKLVKMSNKLKRVLQTFKDKIHRVVTERPDLFVNVGEETSERLDHLISTVEHQATQIDLLQSEHNESEEQLRNEIHELQSSLEANQSQFNNEQPLKTEQLVSGISASELSSDISSSTSEDYQKQINQLQQKLSANEDERTLLRERLNEVELEFRKTLDDHAALVTINEEQLDSLVQERDALVQQQALQSVESQREIEELKQSLSSQPESICSNEEIQSMKETIEQQSEDLKDLSDKYTTLLSQMDSNVNLQSKFDRERKETEERLSNYEEQVQHLISERTNLLDEIQKNAAASSIQPIDNERQIGDQQNDKLVKVSNKLKRALQTFKDKIHRVVTERPDLFVNVGEETSERLDHLISTVEHQATQIDLLQAEHNESEEQLQNEIRELQSSLEAYRYQIENERPTKTEQLVSAAPSSDHTSLLTIDDYQKQINQFQQKLSANEDERTLLRERLNEVELEFRKTLDDGASTITVYEEKLQSLVEKQAFESAESQRVIEQLEEELDQVKQSLIIQQTGIPSDKDIELLHEIIEQQSEQLRHLNEKYVAASSQLESCKMETDERLTNYEKQIQHLVGERTSLLDEIQKNAVLSIQTTDIEKQTGDQQHDKLVKMSTKLKRVLQTFKDKIHRVGTERPDLFVNVGEETSERLDHLISTVEHQGTQIDLLQSERDQLEEQLRNEIQELQSSFDQYRQQIDDEHRVKIHEHRREVQPKQASNDNQWNDWFTDSPQITDKEIQQRDIDIQCELLADNRHSTQEPSDSAEHQEPTVANRLFGFFKNVTSSLSEQLTEEPPTNDWDDQNSPLQFPTEESLVQQTISSPSSIDNLIYIITNKIQQIVSNYPNLFPHSTGDTLEDLNQLFPIIKNFQNEIKELQSSFDTYRNQIENERSIRMEEFSLNNVSTQSLSIVEEHQKEVDELKDKLHENELIYQREIERLLEERDQANKEQYSSTSWNDIPSQTNINDEHSLMKSRLNDCQCQIDDLLRERVSLMEQIKQLAHQPIRQHVEIQTQNDDELSTPSEQRISRRVFEQEMLAWSKESEQLKQFVKQIQVENKKLKDIILKFERITQDYTQENERLKRENQHLAFLSYSSIETIDGTENVTSSDADICYLTLKWLTYEVAERSSDNNEQSSLIMDNNDPYLKQRLHDTERQLKSIRIQNQRLKKQLETYTIQFKHVQHETNTKNQELSTLKIEVDRLRTSETQYRLEVDRLKVDIQCDHVKIQQLERELADLKLEQSNTDHSSTNNLRELLKLKERELNALKEKLDYTTQAHQLELQEAIKANQFSLDNVQRFEQLDQRHQEKRKELETRLGKFCNIVKPIIDNQHLFKEDSIIDIDELQHLITDTEAEQRVTNSLGPIRDCLGLLESQMKDLHHNLIENHARRSKSWKYKVGFECLSCESQWEVTHDIQDLQEACQDPDLFLESSRVEPMSGCSCPLLVDFIENDVRLCLDDILDEVIVRTTVK